MPVPVFVSSTEAFGTLAPVESTTAPVKFPSKACAYKLTVATAHSIIAIAMIVITDFPLANILLTLLLRVLRCFKSLLGFAGWSKSHSERADFENGSSWKCSLCYTRFALTGGENQAPTSVLGTAIRLVL